MSSDILALCKKYGPLLNMPPGSGVDGAKFMAAIAGCESSFGKNPTPRHEPTYDKGGEYAENPPQNELLAHWGSAAAYSYGPWQMMPCNAIGFTPIELANDEEKCAVAFVGFFNRFIMGFRHAMTFDEMAQTYNSGHYTAQPSPGVQKYVADALHYYQSIEFPEAVVPPC